MLKVPTEQEIENNLFILFITQDGQDVIIVRRLVCTSALIRRSTWSPIAAENLSSPLFQIALPMTCLLLWCIMGKVLAQDTTLPIAITQKEVQTNLNLKSNLSLPFRYSGLHCHNRRVIFDILLKRRFHQGKDFSLCNCNAPTPPYSL